jgi:hypothetical protein
LRPDIEGTTWTLIHNSRQVKDNSDSTRLLKSRRQAHSFNMIGSLRRSLGERLLTATSTPCAACYRRIHVNNALHGAAAAQAQPSDHIPVMLPQNLPLNPKAKPQQTSTKRSKTSQQVKQPKQVKNAKQSPQSKATEIKPQAHETEPVGDPLKTASELNSPFNWDSDAIYKLYTPPTEEELPSRIERHERTKGGTKKKTYEWKREPLNYIDEGLQIYINLQSIQLPKGRQRIRLTARWGQISHDVIGDGMDRVSPAPFPF